MRSRGCRRRSRSASRPMATTLEREAAAAREAGHETLLQSPMEPITYPADNPGPHTLLTGATEADNLDALRWQMGRFVGYVGVVNHLAASSPPTRARCRRCWPRSPRAACSISTTALRPSASPARAPRRSASRRRAPTPSSTPTRPRGDRRRARAGWRRSRARTARRSASRPPCRPASTDRPLERRPGGARRRAGPRLGAGDPPARAGG